MKVAILNAWSDDNKGDAAIVEGLARALQAQAEAPPTFALTSMFRRPQGTRDHYRHTRRLAADVKVHPALLPVDRPDGVPRLVARIFEFGRAFALLIAGRSGRWLLSEAERASLASVVDADLVISKGGHVYFSNGTARSSVGLFRNLFPVLLAQRLGRPTVVYGQSIGPVHGRLQRWLLRQGLSRLSGLFVREPLSVSQVEELNIPVEASLCWDSAFEVPPEPLPPDVEEVLVAPFVAVTVRQWSFPYGSPDRARLYERYLASVGHCVMGIQDKLGARVVVVPQVIGPTEMEDDLAAAAQLKDSLPKTACSDAIFLDHDLTAGQLSTLYGRAELVLATRFHSAILAIAAGTPAVAISYHGPKARGIMEMLGLERYVVDIDEVTRDGLWALCAEAYERRERLGDEIHRRHGDIHRSIAESTRQLLGLARSGPPR